MKRIVPSTGARLLMLTAPGGLMTGSAIALLAEQRVSVVGFTLAAVGAVWFLRCARVRVEWDSTDLHIINVARSYAIAWDKVADVGAGHTTSMAVRGVPFSIPTVLTTDHGAIRLLGTLGISRGQMDILLSEITLHTAGRSTGVSCFRGYQAWCKPSQLSPIGNHDLDDDAAGNVSYLHHDQLGTYPHADQRPPE